MPRKPHLYRELQAITRQLIDEFDSHEDDTELSTLLLSAPNPPVESIVRAAVYQTLLELMTGDQGAEILERIQSIRDSK